ncbi:MAG: SurA N-terminal domain-containing protein [Bradyrhizobiaceae bacterium]|nr:SurA N-terminal domain-containing protein [Bradyrhizobiaceae bacterium]
MLRGLQKASANWLGKIIMAAVVLFLVLSFAIWGIGDIFRGAGVSTVAQVGSADISIEQFRQFYNDRLQQISRRVGRPITPDQARATGIDRQILNQLIAEVLLDERARQIGLGMSDGEVAAEIRREPAFQGANGQFDQQRFLYLIRQAGFTEQRFVIEQRRTALRRQLASAIDGDLKAPQSAADLANRYENEERSIEFVALNAQNAGDIPAPTPEQLAGFFEQRKLLFRAPELRKVLFLTLSPQEIAKTIEVSDADAERYYADHRARYTVPEKRQIQQIAFPNAQEAAAAQAKLAGGMTFEALAAERKIPEKDLDLGLVSKAEMLDPAIADAAFALQEGEVSAPVTGRFVTAIVRVTKIEPGQATPYAKVEAEIKQAIALDRAKADLARRRDQIEDELAAGQRLDEIGKKLGLPVRIIDALDRSGHGPKGEPVPDLPKNVDLVAAAFATSVGVENEPLQIPGGGFVWYEVAGVTPSHERTFDEAKPQVEERWREAEIAKRLDQKAAEIAGRVKAGGWVGEIAANGLTLENANGLKRRGSGPLPPGVIAEVFRTPKDGVASAEGAEPTQRIVFRVTGVTVPPLDMQSPAAKRLLDTLGTAYSDDLIAQYVAQLQIDFGVKINQTALNQAIGRGATE